MRVLKTIVVVLCVVALVAASAEARRRPSGPRHGGWHGHRPHGGWHGHRPHGGWHGYRPYGWRPSGWNVYVTSDDWSFSYYGGYTVGDGWGWGYSYPYTWTPRPGVIYRTRTVPVVTVREPFKYSYSPMEVVDVAAPEPVILPLSVASPIRTIEPADPRALAHIGGVVRGGDLARAEADVKRLLLKHPSDAQIHCVYAYVLFLREKYTAASFVLRRALVLDGRLVAAGRMVLEGFYDGEQVLRGLARLDRHVDATPDGPTPRLLRAYLRFLSGFREAAVVDLDALLRTNPTDAQAALLWQFCTDGTPTER